MPQFLQLRAEQIVMFVDSALFCSALVLCARLQANLRNRGLFSEQGCLVAFASNLAGAATTPHEARVMSSACSQR
jgi:hypothetical protein